MPAGRIPDGGDVPGPPLTVGKEGGVDLILACGASCSSQDTDYEIYEGAIGNSSVHTPGTAACLPRLIAGC